MGAAPGSLSANLTYAPQAADTSAPTSTITAPSGGAVFTNGSAVTVSGTASDASGGVVAGVEVSTDGGSSWHPVTTMSAAAASVTWSYTWSAAGNGAVTIKSRAANDSGYIEQPGAGVNVTVKCPCSLFGADYTPSTTSVSDTTPYELGAKFQAAVAGWVTGVRFYKGSGNTGTHTGSLWTSTGTRLATGTFTNESATGWQTLNFATPVQISANTTYVVSYFDPAGHFAGDRALFDWPLNTPPLTAVKSDFLNPGGTNGVVNVGAAGFPGQASDGSSYSVDVVFSTSPPEGLVPSVSSATPAAGSSSIPVSTHPSVTFNEAVVPSSVSFSVKDPGGNTVAGAVAFDASNTVATFTPSAALAGGTTFTVTVSGAQDSAGHTMASPFTMSFTSSRSFNVGGQCPCTIWPDVRPSGATDVTDTGALEVGIRFTPSSNGTITGVRFYKDADNTGTHTGSLWTSTGTQLATGTFTGESSQGWQELDFATPVTVTAGTTYVAGYFSPSAHFTGTMNALASAVTNGPLTAQANGGVYAYSSTATFPNSTFNASNYWVDVVFRTTP